MDVIDHSLENGDERDEDPLGDTEEMKVIASQSLTIVEDDASLGSSEDQAAVAGLTHSMLDGDDDVQYFRSGDGGQFYVIGSPQDVFGASQVQRSLAPRLGSGVDGGPRAVRRDDKRRATHNEVERRRRDKINTWIVELSKVVPDCVPETTKSPGQSKGGILAKAFKYIMELRTQNARLSDGHKQTECLNQKVKHLQRELESAHRKNLMLEQEISILRAQLLDRKS